MARLKLFPAHTLAVRTGLARVLHDRRTAKAQAELRAKGFARLLLPQAPGALPQDHADLMHLYHAVQAQKAQRVIEFGSGQSTVFIAQGLHDQGFGHLWSLDGHAEWLKHTEGLIPEHLKPFVTLIHSPLAVTKEYGIPAWRYTVKPQGEWDFIFVDGPTLDEKVRLSCDLVELAPSLKPGATGFIDHRWRTAVLAKELAGDVLDIRYVPALESFTIRKK